MPDVVFKFLSTARRGIFHADGEEWKLYALVVDFLNHCLTRSSVATKTHRRFLENGDARHEKGQKEAESRERNSAYGNEEVQIIAR